jgi:hypothetical protein
MANMADAANQALEATAGESDQVKSAAVSAAIASVAIPAPPPQEAGFLWKMLVVTLSLGLLGIIGAVIYAALDGSDTTGTDVLITIFTGLLGALIGLFVPSKA